MGAHSCERTRLATFLRRPPSEVMELHVPWKKVIAFASKKVTATGPAKARTGTSSELQRRRDRPCLNAELRGFANCYALAKDVKYKLTRLEFLQRWSCSKDLGEQAQAGDAARRRLTV